MWTPINLFPFQRVDANGDPYSGAVLKAYAAGTTTNISMATDNSGGTTATSIALDSNGDPAVSGNVVIPHIDQKYKIALYADQAGADADSGAIWTIDNIEPLETFQGADIASATALDVDVAGKFHDVTGTTTITSFAAVKVGTLKILQFDGALTLTHHATNLILPGAANITTAAGDIGVFYEYASGNWRCVSYSGQTVTKDLTVNGDTTLGNAAGDSLTIAPSSVTWSNDPTHSGDHTFSGIVTITGPRAIVESTAPIYRYKETDGTTTHNIQDISLSADTLRFATRDENGNLVSQDYLSEKGSSGATNHEWRIESTKKLELTSTGLTVTDALIVAGDNMGYGTGAGDTVTQGTSRTTGVTINKPSGAITLVSAAGTTSWQTFTVTNSVVSATDTIIVNQKSGTDLNQIHVTAVGSGSFDITFATTSGTTTEQPVFNFAVITGATS